MTQDERDLLRRVNAFLDWLTNDETWVDRSKYWGAWGCEHRSFAERDARVSARKLSAEIQPILGENK